MSNETAESTAEIRRSEFLNGGVVIEEKEGDTAEVTHNCVGCGDEVRTFEIFADRIEEELGSKPLCEDTTVECRNRGREEMEGEA